jgi:hypothetical protein
VRSALSDATKEQLIDQANGMATTTSMRGKFSVGFEDTSSANIGKSEKYQNADGEIIVQRPANIYLKIDAPVVKVDIAQMTSDGKKFRVAVLEDGGSGKYKQFVTGSNDADYSSLQKSGGRTDPGNNKAQVAEKNVSTFSKIRPQHFTDALLIRPLDNTSQEFFYVRSEIYKDESNSNGGKGSSVQMINHGYYLLDELKKKGDGLVITRRFWFDRIGTVSLVRQQIFDNEGSLDSDITYGALGKFTATGEYTMPMIIDLTRPKEQYRMKLKYQAPAEVVIGKEYKNDIFTLLNRWELPEVDLDKKLADAKQGAMPIVTKAQ